MEHSLEKPSSFQSFAAKDFRFLIKQKGGLLAKGRLLAIQFLTLFQDNLFFDLAKHEIQWLENTKELKTAFRFY